MERGDSGGSSLSPWLPEQFSYGPKFAYSTQKTEATSLWPEEMLTLITAAWLPFPKYCFQQITFLFKDHKRYPTSYHIQAKLPINFTGLSLRLKPFYNLVLLPSKPDFPKLLTTIPITFYCATNKNTHSSCQPAYHAFICPSYLQQHLILLFYPSINCVPDAKGITLISTRKTWETDVNLLSSSSKPSTS